jgi:CRISPR-associated protein Cas6
MNTMYWQEETSEKQFVVPDDIVDLMFGIRCATLPVDHAWELSDQIQQALPWFEGEPTAGLHIIHGADSGNGWERPQGADELLHLSRRTKLTLRLPRHRVEDAATLSGRVFTVGEHRMEIGESKTRLLSMTTILYSRYLASRPEWSEQEFTEWAVGELKGMGLRFKKVLCGKSYALATPKGPLPTRSLMVADLSHQDAITLQERGIGPRRSMGLGLFVPQKSF